MKQSSFLLSALDLSGSTAGRNASAGDRSGLAGGIRAVSGSNTVGHGLGTAVKLRETNNVNKQKESKTKQTRTNLDSLGSSERETGVGQKSGGGGGVASAVGSLIGHGDGKSGRKVVGGSVAAGALDRDALAGIDGIGQTLTSRVRTGRKRRLTQERKTNKTTNTSRRNLGHNVDLHRRSSATGSSVRLLQQVKAKGKRDQSENEHPENRVIGKKKKKV
jgi:hypothetical protein